MSTQTNSEKKLKNCLQNKFSPRLARGFSLLSAYQKKPSPVGEGGSRRLTDEESFSFIVNTSSTACAVQASEVCMLPPLGKAIQFYRQYCRGFRRLFGLWELSAGEALGQLQHTRQGVGEEGAIGRAEAVFFVVVAVTVATVAAERNVLTFTALVGEMVGALDEAHFLSFFVDLGEVVRFQITEEVIVERVEVAGIDEAVGLDQILHRAAADHAAFLGRSAEEDADVVFKFPMVNLPSCRYVVIPQIEDAAEEAAVFLGGERVGHFGAVKRRDAGDVLLIGEALLLEEAVDLLGVARTFLCNNGENVEFAVMFFQKCGGAENGFLRAVSLWVEAV